MVLLLALSCTALAQWVPQRSGTDAGLRGLSVVNANVVWASGTGGTFLRTTDGGETWQKGTVPGAEKIDFRDVHAVDPDTAYLLSIGPGASSRIYKTTDAGRTWSQQYTHPHPQGFLDCMAFWDARHGLVFGDPIDGHFDLLESSDGGAHWNALQPQKLPAPEEGETGGFAASGTCLAVAEKKYAWFVTGGKAPRVLRTTDGGKTWTAASTPIVGGNQSSGIFSIAFADVDRGVIVGGDYRNPAEPNATAAYSSDGGKTWTASAKPPSGFRSGVAIVPDTPGPTAIAVGTNGTDYSLDRGRNWTKLSDDNLNAVAFADAHHGWAVGPKGRILKFSGTVPGGTAPSLRK